MQPSVGVSACAWVAMDPRVKVGSVRPGQPSVSDAGACGDQRERSERGLRAGTFAVPTSASASPDTKTSSSM